MNSVETDRLASQMQAAYEKSGYTAKDFAWYCYENKESVVGFAEGELDTDPEVALAVVTDQVYTYYFKDRWYCKV